MKPSFALLLAASLAAPVLFAQAPANGNSATRTQSLPTTTPDPIVWSGNQIYSRQSNLLVAAAEEMPEDKFTYRPTPGQMTFAHILSHVAQSNGGLCAMLSGSPAPDAVKVADTAPKPELIAALKASFAFCDDAMAHLTDAKLREQVPFRRATAPRAMALFELDVDLQDHYSQMAGYLRLNGLLPPSAQPRK